MLHGGPAGGSGVALQDSPPSRVEYESRQSRAKNVNNDAYDGKDLIKGAFSEAFQRKHETLLSVRERDDLEDNNEFFLS